MGQLALLVLLDLQVLYHLLDPESLKVLLCQEFLVVQYRLWVLVCQ